MNAEFKVRLHSGYQFSAMSIDHACIRHVHVVVCMIVGGLSLLFISKVES